MQLRASIAVESRPDEPLASVTPIRDESRKFDDQNFIREIVASIDSRSPIWNDFFALWQSPEYQPQMIDGFEYRFVLGLQVDFDFYFQKSWFRIEADKLYLRLFEAFSDTVDQHRKLITARNQKVAAYHARWESYQVTPNDLRQLLGLPPLIGPQFDQPLPRQEILANKHLLQEFGISRQLTRNTIH